MKISVIVSTYNKPDYLKKVMLGYQQQNDRDFELVIADDGSGEETRRMIETVAGEGDVPVRHVWQADDGFRKCEILNKAIEAAEGEYLIFTDGDCIPRRDTVAVHRANARPGFYLVGAYNRLPMTTSLAIGDDDIRSQRIFKLVWLLQHGYRPTRGFVRILVPPGLGAILDLRGEAGWGRFPGCHASCYRADAQAIGGFDERFKYGADDRDFGTRLCNLGIKPKRIKHSTYVLHLDHDRPYMNEADMRRNREMLREVETSGRVRAGHLGNAA